VSYIDVRKSEEHITIIKLNRPEVYNALNKPLLLELSSVLDEIHHCKKTRVVIVTGEKVFCSGADLKERVSFTEDDVREYIQLIRDTFTKVESLPQPVIAAMWGYAFGGGMELALACDIRVAGEDTLFGLLETSLAIIPGAGGTQRLPRIIGEAKAKELIFLAKKFSVAEAKELGLVNIVVENENVMETTLHMAQKIARNGPLAIRQAKLAIHQGREGSFSRGLEMETKAYDPLISTSDRLEGLAAFREKRTPQFIGK
jgi:enoyl-CoA hydratase/carnithine racemase